MKKITVLLVEDHALVRDGLSALLKLEEGFLVVGEAANGRQAVEMAVKLSPAVIVMDIAMPLLNGLEAMRQILKSNSRIKIVILSAHSDDAYVSNALKIGAAGFVLKQNAACVLPEAIRKVYKGGQFLSTEILRKLDLRHQKSKLRGELTTNDGSVELTSREMEVLQLVAEGKANKETAAELHISIKTVEKHRQSLMEKVNIHDTAGLTRYAISSGIIESSIQITTSE